MALLGEEKKRLSLAVGRIFTPSSPVSEKDLFSGRFHQLTRLVDAINQRGRHGIIFGERGVGKTSLANVLKAHLDEQELVLPVLVARIQCDVTYDYSMMWSKIFEELEVPCENNSLRSPSSIYGSADLKNGYLTLGPALVRKALTIISDDAILIIIIDEFDRLVDDDAKLLLADTIKALSDNPINATIVVVGVGDSIDELIEEHESVERALTQIKMPRMSEEELRNIVLNGLNRLGSMEIEGVALNHLSLLSQGLPHYAHLLALHATRDAIYNGQPSIQLSHVENALKNALADTEQSVMNAYHKATGSSRPESLFEEVLQACALAPKDDFGYFRAIDVKRPMSQIMLKEYGIDRYARHLNQFCQEERGAIFQKMGERRNYRYRFRNPLLQPYTLMKGLHGGKISRGLLEEYSSRV